VAMPHPRRPSGLGFAGLTGSRREAWPPGRVQNPSLEVQVLLDPASGGRRRQSDVATFSSSRSVAIRFCSVRRLIPSISAARLRFPCT
jgi:hypothetical protein